MNSFRSSGFQTQRLEKDLVDHGVRYHQDLLALGTLLRYPLSHEKVDLLRFGYVLVGPTSPTISYLLTLFFCNILNNILQISKECVSRN